MLYSVTTLGDFNPLILYKKNPLSTHTCGCEYIYIYANQR